jgi:hypothetical protein
MVTLVLIVTLIHRPPNSVNQQEMRTTLVCNSLYKSASALSIISHAEVIHESSMHVKRVS